MTKQTGTINKLLICDKLSIITHTLSIHPRPKTGSTIKPGTVAPIWKTVSELIHYPGILKIKLCARK